MTTDLTAFKAYDVRGEFGTELTPPLAEKIAHATVLHLCETYNLSAPVIAVGHDMRIHSLPLYEAVNHGIQKAGGQVLAVGLVSTPMLYFAVNRHATDGGIMITASHNPAKDNGLKICRTQAIPIAGGSENSELEQIKQRVATDTLPAASRIGELRSIDVKREYRDRIIHLAQQCDLKDFRIVTDFANGMGSVEAKVLQELFAVIPMYETLDGTFPNHPANPLNAKNLADVSAATRQHNADFGLAFDGDADRVGFVDERGEIIPMDLITGMIATWYLQKQAGNVLHDLRTSRATLEAIRDHGGNPIACRVGHSFLKQKMREHDGIFGGELAGHFYFNELNGVESTALAVIRIAALLSQSRKTLSELAAPFRKYANSGELNLALPVREAAAVSITRLKAAFPEAAISELDGLLLETTSWWCNVRPSNTEPRLRIVIEASTQSALTELTVQIMNALQAPDSF